MPRTTCSLCGLDHIRKKSDEQALWPSTLEYALEAGEIDETRASELSESLKLGSDYRVHKSCHTRVWNAHRSLQPKRPKTASSVATTSGMLTQTEPRILCSFQPPFSQSYLVSCASVCSKQMQWMSRRCPRRPRAPLPRPPTTRLT